MKRIFTVLGLVLSLVYSLNHVQGAKGQTLFFGNTGAIYRCATQSTFSNASTTSDQALFTSTIPGNTLATEKPYQFYCDMVVTTGALALPTISFDVKVGTNTLTFVSSAGMLTGITNAVVNISGYVVKCQDGSLTVKFSVAPASTLAGITITSSNTVQYASWTVDTTVDQPFSVNVAFGSIVAGGNVVLKRIYYVRSEF